jgi:hypothetical protein
MTNVLAPGPNKSNRTILWIDREAFEVLSITTTTATCNRGYYGTFKSAHLAGTPVWVGSESDFSYFNQNQSGEAGLGLYSRLSTVCGTANPAALTGTATLTTVQLLGRVIVGTPTAGATYTTDTATLILAGLSCFSNPFIGQYFVFTIVNSAAGAYTITLAGGTGVTLVGGTLTIAQNAARTFVAVVTATATPAVTIYQAS